MSTCVALLLCAFGVAPLPAGPNWLSDYGQALRQARAAESPLLVVLHNPNDTTHRLDAAPASVNPASGPAPAVPIASRLLRNYVLCDVDVSTPYGRRVAGSFKATRFPHTVIIDRTASVQIFRKTGRLTASEWTATLNQHRSGERYVPQAWREPVFCST
jgi:hypothetical protein